MISKRQTNTSRWSITRQRTMMGSKSRKALETGAEKKAIQKIRMMKKARVIKVAVEALIQRRVSPGTVTDQV